AEVKRLRICLGISQEELAERADLHRTYVSDVEAGKRNPSLASIQRLASALGSPLSQVFVAAEEPGAGGSGGDEPMAGRVADILLLEDDPKEIELVLRAFQKAKLANRIQAVTASNQALGFLFNRGIFAKRRVKRMPQVIMLDLELPNDQALGLLRRLKS